MTTKVYGLRKAMRTMAFMREVYQKRFDFLSFGHLLPKGPLGFLRSHRWFVHSLKRLQRRGIVWEQIL